MQCLITETGNIYCVTQENKSNYKGLCFKITRDARVDKNSIKIPKCKLHGIKKDKLDTCKVLIKK